MFSNVNKFREETDAKRIIQIREITRELPQSCSDFIRSIAVTTSTLTRLAYAIDLRTFFQFLQSERVAFSDMKLSLMTDQDLEKLTRNDLTAYTEYLTFYYKNESSVPNKAYVNHELSIKRKLCSIRSFYDYLFKNQRISSNITELVPLPKIHEKPIIRLSLEEMERILELAQSGDKMTKTQQRYQKITAKRDYALLSLFLGTGIRVSECVGMNISDVDFENNAFVVTRQRAVQNLVKKYAYVAAPLKQKISPHKLRSTFAKNLYNETGDIYLVADVLGHSSVDTTRKHYADMTDARRRMAAEHVHLPGDPDFPKGTVENSPMNGMKDQNDNEHRST